MKYVLSALLFLSALTGYATPRYFVASYTYSLDSTASSGTIGFSCQNAPAKASIIYLVRTTYKVPAKAHIVILSLSEFKSKAEYDVFFTGKPYILSTPVFDSAVMRSITKVAVHDTIPPPAVTMQRTWYMRDLHILPNTGKCLTDTIQQVINSAIALGGTTQIVISDEGTYNFNNAFDVSTPNAEVHLIYNCYPTDMDKVKEISVGKCN